MLQNSIEIELKNNTSIFATQFTPKHSNSKSIVISSATGVLQSFYAPFAMHFCDLGFTVYTFDYSGIGLSHSKAIANNTSNLYDWAANQGAVLNVAKTQNPTHTVTLITHSIGGQLIVFNKQIGLADSIITVASQSGYWKLFLGFQKLKMYLFWNAIIPITTPIYNYVPTKKLGLFENLPKQVAYHWRRWGNNSNYFLSDANTDASLIDSISCPMLILSFPNDNLAPKRTVDWFASVFKNANVDRRHICPKTLKVPEIGHFGFFRKRFETSLWNTTAQWIDDKT